MGHYENKRTNIMKKITLRYSIYLILAVVLILSFPGNAPAPPLTWKNSIRNTYHNLSAVFQNMGIQQTNNQEYLNNYRKVCVYCHTPHASNRTIPAPIWNRTVNTGFYSMYKSPTMDSPFADANRPGWASLVCLTCHDGTIAVDSIVNMPGSGRYSKAQETAVNISFLNTWSSVVPPSDRGHMGLQNPGCMSCHSSVGNGGIPLISDPKLFFETYAIGTDLRNDHPIGMQYARLDQGLNPSAAIKEYDPKFNKPTNYDTTKQLWWFENTGVSNNNPNMANDDDVKLWGSNGTVECASCHNPHGTIKDDGSGDIIRPFLRVDNTKSSLCLTCHIK